MPIFSNQQKALQVMFSPLRVAMYSLTNPRPFGCQQVTAKQHMVKMLNVDVHGFNGLWKFKPLNWWFSGNILVKVIQNQYHVLIGTYMFATFINTPELGAREPYPQWSAWSFTQLMQWLWSCRHLLLSNTVTKHNEQAAIRCCGLDVTVCNCTRPANWIV